LRVISINKWAIVSETGDDRVSALRFSSHRKFLKKKPPSQKTAGMKEREILLAKSPHLHKSDGNRISNHQGNGGTRGGR